MRKIGGAILLLALVVGIVIPAFAYTLLWPEFRGNAFRSGQGPSDVFGPENPILAWNWGNGGRLGIPVVRESGDVYLGTEQNSVIGLRADGSLSFTYQALGPVFYPPTLMANGMVFVSGDPDSTGDTHLEMYVNGGQSWTYTPTIGRIVTAPLVDGSTIYFGTVEIVPEGTRSRLVAVDSQGRTLWSTPLEWSGPGGIPALAPALWRDASANTQILLGTESGSNGERGGLWRLKEDGSIDSVNTILYGMQGTPAVGMDGTIYVQNGNGTLLVFNSGGSYSGPPSVGLGSVTIAQASPAVASDGTIYLGVTEADGSGSLMAIDQNGNGRWSTSFQFGMADVRPTIDGDGTIYFATTRLSPAYETQTTRCDLFAVRPDGTLKWQFTHELSQPCAPVQRFGYAPDVALAPNMLFVTAGNQLLAIGNGAPTPSPSPSVSPTALPLFWDLPTDYWALGPIKVLVDAGVLNGYPDGSFRPENAVTRAEFCKMILLTLGRPLGTAASPTFPDVSTDHWAYQYVETAYKDGLVIGYPDGSFHPEGSITIAEVLTMLVRTTAWERVNPSSPPTILVREPDGTVRNLSTADWFYQTVGTAMAHHLLAFPDDPHIAVPGAGSDEYEIAFNTPATRAQTVVLLWRLD